MARPHKSRSNQLPQPVGGQRSRSFDKVLSLTIPVVLNGERTLLSAEEALLLDLRIKARGGDSAAAELLAEFSDLAASIDELDENQVFKVRRVIVAPGSVTHELELLRMAKKFDRESKKTYMKLEPWIVEAALDRLGDKQLSLEEQRNVLSATRTPHKVAWPRWWQINQ